VKHRPLSFTKNLGGLQHLYEAIRCAYSRGVCLHDFRRRLPASLRKNELIISEFFLATQILNREEIIADDALIRETLERAPLDLTLKRLYLFSLLLNMPGQRLKAEYSSPAGAQNDFVRTYLHDTDGWLADRLDLDRHIEPWVRDHVALTTGRRKFCTNFRYFFEQCEFPVSRNGHLRTFADHWGPLALRLFFDRYRIDSPNASLDDLVGAIYEHEIHKLLGMPLSWVNEIADGAALAYLSNRNELLTGTQESTGEAEEETTGPVGRKSVQSQQLMRSTKNKRSLEGWYGKVCQICGNKLPAGKRKLTIDYAHIQPLGSPHNGPDSVSNMLSLCPNHHRQLDTGAISIEPATTAILAPRGSAPSVLGKLHVHGQHRLSLRALHYHKGKCFKAGQQEKEET